jgi:hypothetical protein
MVSPYVVIFENLNIAGHDKAHLKRASRGHVPIIGASAAGYLDSVGHIASPYGINPICKLAHNANCVLMAGCVRVVG